MRVDRLNALADFLETVPAKNFDMRWWVGSAGRNGYKLLSVNFAECGTTACAMGWAAVMPQFQSQGLCWYGNDFMGQDSAMKYGDTIGEPARIGAEFFDIPFDDAIYLFKASHRDAQEQAAYIRAYIASKPECVRLFNEENASTNPEPSVADRPIEGSDGASPGATAGG